jgi:hypothetical protein
MAVTKVIDIGAPADQTKSLDDLVVDEALGFKVHPFAASFPMLKGRAVKAFTDDIRANGLRERIQYLDHKGEKIIVDGRNRLRACNVTGVKPEFCKYPATDDEDLLNFIWSKNVRRRNLTESQRAMLAAQHKKFVGAIAKRKEEAKKSNLKRGTKKPAKSRKGNVASSGSTAKVLADTAKVSERTMKDALAVEKSGDKKLAEEVIDGTTSVNAAAKKVRKKRATAKVPDHLPHMDAKGIIHPPRKAPPKETPRQAAKDLMEIHGAEWCLKLAKVIGDLATREGAAACN